MRLQVVAVSMFLLMLNSTVAGHQVTLPDSFEQLELTRITANAYSVHGLLALPDKHNNAFISNAGVVIGDEGVVLIDTGGSRQVGEQIISKIRMLTDKPVVAVFNTHVHGDHWLGNAAVRQVYPDVKIYAHARAIERLRNGEADRWLDIMMNMTEGSIDGTRSVLPDIALEGGEVLDLGGVVLAVHHTGHAHTDSDIMLEYPRDRLLFSGDIIEHLRAVSVDVPEDFSALGQIDAIRYALALPVDIFVPGHGKTGGREIPESSLRFLEILHGSVKRYYEADMEDFEMRDLVVVDLGEFRDWSGFDQIGKLISSVYLQVEAAEF